MGSWQAFRPSSAPTCLTWLSLGRPCGRENDSGCGDGRRSFHDAVCHFLRGLISPIDQKMLLLSCVTAPHFIKIISSTSFVRDE